MILGFCDCGGPSCRIWPEFCNWAIIAGSITLPSLVVKICWELNGTGIVGPCI